MSCPISRISRIDGRRTVVITGNVDSGQANVGEIQSDTSDRFLPELQARIPRVEIQLKGEVAGLIPLLFERRLQAQILVPLVTSLAFGLIASTILVLVVVPVRYAILHDLRPRSFDAAVQSVFAAGEAEIRPADSTGHRTSPRT